MGELKEEARQVLALNLMLPAVVIALADWMLARQVLALNLMLQRNAKEKA